MKIISKHKDYYDYIVGIYGEDPNLVYDRRVRNIKRFDVIVDSPRVLTPIKFFICGLIYNVYYFREKFYCTAEQIYELNEILHEEDYNYVHGNYRNKKPSLEDLQDYVKCIKTDINMRLRQPVLVQGGSEWALKDGRGFNNYYSLPHLETYGAATWYPAQDIYQDIVAFIGWLKDHPEIPDKMTNDEKILSHGFDIKKSFRHRKQ